MPQDQHNSYRSNGDFSELNEYAESDFAFENQKLNLKVVNLEEPKIFEGWNEVSDNYKTREDWELLFRKVKNNEQPAAKVRTFRTQKIEAENHEYQVEHFNNLYHVSQTREVRRTSLALARRYFYEAFVAHASWQRQIKWTQGGFVYTEDGGRRWDETIEDWGWRTYKRKVSLANVSEHQTGKEIYGVFGGKRSYFLLIDLDLHNQPLDLFLKRLDLLLDHFHGKYRCHFQVADSGARGVHVILFFGTPGNLKTRTKWLLRELSEIDAANPSGKFTITVNSEVKYNIEVYPCTSAVRLPLARERKMLLDKPLDLVKSRGKEVQDVVGYMNWLRQPPSTRRFMPKDDVKNYILERLELNCAKPEDSELKEASESPKRLVTRSPVTEHKPTKTSKSATVINKPKKLSFKGKTRPAIIGFWRDGKEDHFLHLNSAIHTTLGAIHAEGLAEDDAVEIVFQYACAIPNKELSSRLVDGLPLVRKDIARNAAKIWELPVNRIWAKAVSCWSSYGFKVSDRTTWDAKPKSNWEEVVVDCEEICFDEKERQKIVNLIAPVLVGKKQANKKEKQDEVERAVAYFLRYVKCCQREIPYNHVGKILSGFAIKWGYDYKSSQFLDLLKKCKWIYVQALPFCPKIHKGSGRGRATKYGIGKKMAYKFEQTLSPTNNKHKDLFISSIFCKDSVQFSAVEEFTGGSV